MSDFINLNEETESVDYSGRDFADQEISGKSFFQSIFNGVELSRMIFDNVSAKHAEFTESELIQCSFQDCNLNHSDFVYTKLQNCIFNNCTFTNVEWRESTFHGCKFLECQFENSTISLCSFKNSLFDLSSSLNFYGQSKRYNIFVDTKMEIGEGTLEFLHRNFGIQGTSETRLKESESDLLFNLSLQKFGNYLNTRDLIQGIVDILERDLKSRKRNTQQVARYIVLIVKTQVEESKISVIAAQYFVNALSKAMTTLNDSFLFLEFMDLLVFLKTFTVRKVKEIKNEVEEYSTLEANNIRCRVTLYNTYGQDVIRDFLTYFSQRLKIDAKRVELRNYQTGSTIFEFLISASVKLSEVLTILKFFLSEVKLIWSKWSEIRDNLSTYSENAKHSKIDLKNKDSIKRVVVSGEHPSDILKESVENQDLIRNQNLLDAIGDQLLNIEGPAEVQIALEIKINKT